jgi:FkbM family methyltransferase
MEDDANTAEAQSHAQFGEDRILAEIFSERSNGYCVEVGADDGYTGSATYLFEKRGWHCLLVEPIPESVAEIHRHRTCAVVNCAASNREGEATFGVAEGVKEMSTLDLTPDHVAWIERFGGEIREITVRTATLDRLLAEVGFPEIQFITIDVEGHEIAVLEGFTLEAHKPRIVIIEDNSIGGNVRVAKYMSDRGYVHFRRTGVNEWYAHESDGELVQPDQIRRFERAKTWQLWERRRKRAVSRIATWGGHYLPAPVKRRLRGAFDSLRPSAPRRG